MNNEFKPVFYIGENGCKKVRFSNLSMNQENIQKCIDIFYALNPLGSNGYVLSYNENNFYFEVIFDNCPLVSLHILEENSLLLKEYWERNEAINLFSSLMYAVLYGRK